MVFSRSVQTDGSATMASYFWFLVPYLSTTAIATSANFCGNARNSSNTVVSQNNDRIKGWVDSPDTRGTLDILWSCVVTIFICTYTILCLNLPAPGETWWTIMSHRLFWMGLAVIGPEFVLTYAAGQWSRARHSVKAFHHAGYLSWTMRKAFYADMGGFVLHAKDSTAFPLNAKHLYWLVVNKHVDLPTITDDEIGDKSKQDTLAKLITTFQVGFLIIQSIGRATQKLAITTLELNALAIVVCSVMTSLTWLQKPSNVHQGNSVHTSARIQDITESREWQRTPLDFIDENGPGYSINVQPFMKMPAIPSERPLQRIPDDRFPMDPYGSQEYLLCSATLIFAAIHVAGWNFSFPSKIEQILWRSASMLIFGITAAF